MKTLSLIQPWASLIAVGAKRIETRSWYTNYRGPLAIHASKAKPDMLSEARRVIDLVGTKSELPLGQIICVCNLVDVLPTEARGCLAGVFEDHPDLKTENEELFGNYDPGRWGFVLENVQRIDPVDARGSLGLWECPLVVLP